MQKIYAEAETKCKNKSNAQEGREKYWFHEVHTMVSDNVCDYVGKITVMGRPETVKCFFHSCRIRKRSIHT